MVLQYLPTYVEKRDAAESDKVPVPIPHLPFRRRRRRLLPRHCC
jgi:hypothetical protein